MAFTYQFEQKNGIVIVSFSGRLVDKVEAIDVSAEIEEQLNDGSTHFIIDLSGLEYMNSTGLNIIINLMNKTRNEGGEVVIAGAQPRIKALFDVTKLSSIFKLTQTLEEANAAFSNSK